MKITIATPLYPPDLGGPALYAKHLGDEFRALGHEVRVAVFSPFLRFPSGIRHLRYLWEVLRAARGADVIFTLDYMSAGIPAMLASVILNIPLVLRFEGDFFWERTAERMKTDLTLTEFSRRTPPLPLKDWILMLFGKRVIRRSRAVVCSSEWRRRMLDEQDRARATIIQNALPEYRQGETARARERVVLWAGRMMHLKNLVRLIRAFAAAGDERYELHLVGDGPERRRLEKMVRDEHIQRVRFFPAIPHDALMERMARAVIFAFPSLSDVWPNVIVEAISNKTPFFMTRESGLAEFVKDIGIVVDPKNEEEIRRAIATLMRDDARGEYEKKLAEFRFRRSWREAAEDWITLFRETLNPNF